VETGKSRSACTQKQEAIRKKEMSAANAKLTAQQAKQHGPARELAIGIPPFVLVSSRSPETIA